METQERRGSKPGEQRGDQSTANRMQNVLEEQLVEVITRAQATEAGDRAEMQALVNIRNEVDRLILYNRESEDRHHREVVLAARRCFAASQKLEEAYRAHDLETARRHVRMAIEMIQGASSAA